MARARRVSTAISDGRVLRSAWDLLRSSLLRCQTHNARLGISHEFEVGSKWHVDGVINLTLRSGLFHASAASKMRSPLLDRATIFPDVANPSFQDTTIDAIEMNFMGACLVTRLSAKH